MLGYVAHWRCAMYLTDNLLSGGLSRSYIESGRRTAGFSGVSSPFNLLIRLFYLFVMYVTLNLT